MSVPERVQADLSAHIDGELPEPQAEKLEAFVAKTPAARQEEEDLRQVVSQVRALEPIEAPKDFARGVMARVDDLVAARAARAMRPQRRRRRSADPFANDPFAGDPPTGAPDEPGFGPDPMCVSYAEDISAALDGELTPEQEQTLYRHLKGCRACRRLQRQLFEVSDWVQALPRIPTPLGFMTRITDRIDAERLEETRANLRIHHERRVWLTRLGHLAQAACFLLVAGGALALTTPDERPLARLSTATARRAAPPSPPSFLGFGKKQADRKPAAEADAAGSSIPNLPGGKYEVQVELETRDLPAARRALGNLLREKGAKIEREVGSDKDAGIAVQLKRNALDDVRDGLTKNTQVEVSKQAVEALDRVHAEYDQVELKNGFVLVGHARDRGDGTIELKVGDRVYTVDKADVARIDEAEQAKRVKIVLRKRD